MQKLIRPLVMVSLLAMVAGQADDLIEAAAKPVKYPFGLSVAGPIEKGSGDAFFYKLRDAVLGNNLTNGDSVPGIASVRLDPSKIDLALTTDVRAYMVGDQGGNGKDREYAVGFNPAGPGVTTGDPKLIFPLAQTNGSSRNSTYPLLPGDYVDLGKFAAGSHLDFFAIADPTPGYSTHDKEDLAKVFSTAGGDLNARMYALTGTAYLLVTFEGKDKFGVDYNDVAIAVNVGADNIRHLMGAPEPSLLLALGSFAGVLLTATGRHRRQG
jgi:hypothetical protein